MGPQLLTAFILLGLAVSVVENSNLESSDDESVSDLTSYPPSAGNVDYYSARRAFIQASPVELIRSSSSEPLLTQNQKRPYYDPQIFLLLGMDDIRNDLAPATAPAPATATATASTPTSSSEFGLTALENAVKADSETIELTWINQSLMAKSIASLFLAIIFLLFYNGVFLHLFH